jgi:hypothetical protein
MSEMIYSRWRPDEGGYDYFAVDLTQNINDDLPAPELESATKIGVPSIEAGRPIPAGARKVGSGDEALGLMAPVDANRIVRRTRSLGALTLPEGVSPWLFAAAGVGVVAIVFWIRKR